MSASRCKPAMERVAVVLNELLAEGVFRVVLDAPRTAACVRPGQFVHVRIARDAAFILRRPFSVHRAYDGRIEILYQVVGKGTQALAESAPGAVMDVLGPLGTGWSIPRGVKRALLVAGGLGVAPMGMLAEELASKGVALTLAHGAPTGPRLLGKAYFEELCCRAEFATDDGSFGACGLVTELTPALLEEDRPQMAYVCGPEPMQRIAAQQCARAGVPCQVSLERFMACGVGACLSCVVETRGGLKRACVDGPVFDAAEVVWGSCTDQETSR